MHEAEAVLGGRQLAGEAGRSGCLAALPEEIARRLEVATVVLDEADLAQQLGDGRSTEGAVVGERGLVDPQRVIPVTAFLGHACLRQHGVQIDDWMHGQLAAMA